MTIYPLKDGDFSVNKNKDFIYLSEAGDTPGLKMAVQPFCVKTEKHTILLDAGIGYFENGIPKIVLNLQANGIAPEAIDLVLLSHLHKDHIEGLVAKNVDGWKLNFPNAKVYLQKREYDFAMSKAGSPSFDMETLAFIIENANIVWMSENQGNITEEISFEVTGGHTPFHQVFWIKEDGKIVFYGADNLPQAGYLKFHIAYKTDYDGKTAMEQRQRWEVQAQKEHWQILFYHDMKESSLVM